MEVRIISKLLGHASVEITYNRYIHSFEGDIDDTLRQAVGHKQDGKDGRPYRNGNGDNASALALAHSTLHPPIELMGGCSAEADPRKVLPLPI